MTHLHRTSKETYNFFRVTLAEINFIIINYVYIKISYNTHYRAQLSTNGCRVKKKKKSGEIGVNGLFKKSKKLLNVHYTQKAVQNIQWQFTEFQRWVMWSWAEQFEMFDKALRYFTPFLSFVMHPFLFSSDLYPKLINFDTMDFNECCSKEVIFFNDQCTCYGDELFQRTHFYNTGICQKQTAIYQKLDHDEWFFQHRPYSNVIKYLKLIIKY